MGRRNQRPQSLDELGITGPGEGTWGEDLLEAADFEADGVTGPVRNEKHKPLQRGIRDPPSDCAGLILRNCLADEPLECEFAQPVARDPGANPVGGRSLHLQVSATGS